MIIKNISNDSFSSIIGLEDIKKQLRSALILGRHVVLVGGPGMGKTTMVKDVAKMINQEKEVFVRVQGSPDLTVEDLIGDIDPLKAMEYGPLSKEAFTPGKIFKADGGILFFDELNRCSQRLQNALLQVLEEKKVTIGRFDVDVDVDFVFIGTMNPQDTNTEPLSDVLLDRFDLIYVHYPTKQQDEEQIVRARGQKLVEFPAELYAGMIEFIRNLRDNKNIEKVPSVRASIGLYERSQAVAQINGRDKVSPFDIMEALPSVLAHRIRLKPSVGYTTTTEKFLSEQFSEYCEQAGISLEAQGP